MELTGLGRYAVEVTRALCRSRPQWRFSLFSNRPELLKDAPPGALRRTRWRTTTSLGRLSWVHMVSALESAPDRPDLWYSPSFIIPLWWRGPSVVTVHDLTFSLLRGRYRGRLNALHASGATKLSTRRASRVISVSEETRNQILGRLKVDPEKVEVIRNGVSDVFFSSNTPSSRDSDERPYLLSVGTFEARKGLDALHSALRWVNRERPRVRLVLAGRPGWGADRIVDGLRRDPDVEIVTEPSDEVLAELYRGALALVYPSMMEGFGLPVAEAMAAGCPVIASDLGCVREFARDLPLYFSPGDSTQLGRHVESLLDEPTRRRDLCELGWRVASDLKWETVGERVGDAIELSLSRP
jgi:glycosyltransferase involved in cell wall biosynthesis